jgi:hypothetical protein
MVNTADYFNDQDLLKGYNLVEHCTNGKSDEAFFESGASSRPDGSFHKDMLTQYAFERFIDDGYIEPIPGQSGWFRKVKPKISDSKDDDDSGDVQEDGICT